MHYCADSLLYVYVLYDTGMPPMAMMDESSHKDAGLWRPQIKPQIDILTNLGAKLDFKSPIRNQYRTKYFFEWTRWLILYISKYAAQIYSSLLIILTWISEKKE